MTYEDIEWQNRLPGRAEQSDTRAKHREVSGELNALRDCLKWEAASRLDAVTIGAVKRSERAGRARTGNLLSQI